MTPAPSSLWPRRCASTPRRRCVRRSWRHWPCLATGAPLRPWLQRSTTPRPTSRYARRSQRRSAGSVTHRPWRRCSSPVGTPAVGYGLRVAARKALTGMGQGAVTQLIKALDHSSDRVRARAAEALGGLNNPRAVEPLEARRTDPELAVRAAVVEALVELGRKPEGHGNSRFEPYAASSYSWMRPPRRSRLRTPPRVLAGPGGSEGASGARRSSPRWGRLAL